MFFEGGKGRGPKVSNSICQNVWGRGSQREGATDLKLRRKTERKSKGSRGKNDHARIKREGRRVKRQAIITAGEKNRQEKHGPIDWAAVIERES